MKLKITFEGLCALVARNDNTATVLMVLHDTVPHYPRIWVPEDLVDKIKSAMPDEVGPSFYCWHLDKANVRLLDASGTAITGPVRFIDGSIGRCPSDAQNKTFTSWIADLHTITGHGAVKAAFLANAPTPLTISRIDLAGGDVACERFVTDAASNIPIFQIPHREQALARRFGFTVEKNGPLQIQLDGHRNIVFLDRDSTAAVQHHSSTKDASAHHFMRFYELLAQQPSAKDIPREIDTCTNAPVVWGPYTVRCPLVQARE